MKYCVTINNKRYEIEVEKGSASIVSKKEIAAVALESKNNANTQAAATVVSANQTPEAVTTIFAEKAAPKGTETPAQNVVESPVTGKEEVKAPMAGTILDIKVSVGLTVRTGDILLSLEAMKMENEITAHVDGTVAELRVYKGTNVSAGDVLVVIR